jgi:BirA family biotin operon repressor/biotin-[acetyl-CoA-carboxylase] ligase
MKPIKVIKLSAVGSTNNYARGQVVPFEAVEGTVVLAREHLSGRGTGSNTWESEPGKNLTFSIHLKPIFLDPARQFWLSMAGSLGVADFIAIYTKNVSVKWPNDIYAGNRKIAGILIENMIIGNKLSDSIVGIGININQELFSSGVPNPVSLKQLTGADYDLDYCFGEAVDLVLDRYEQLKQPSSVAIHSEYLAKLFRMNEWAEYKSKGETFTGRITGISEYGALKVQTSDSELREFAFKEIEFIL